MTPAEMRARFRAGANDLDAALGDGDIDKYLDRAFRFVVPADTGARLAERLYTLTTTSGQRTYTLAGGDVGPEVYALGSDLTAWIRDANDLFPINIETDPSRWEWVHAGDPATQARPRAGLLYGRDLTLWPTPDDAYTITFPSMSGPAASYSDSSSLGIIADDRVAMACVQAGLMDYHSETEDEASYLRAEREYRRWRSLLMRSVHGRAHTRHQARSF